MKKHVLIFSAVVMPAVSFAALYGDTPDAKHAWAVHDRNRPNPVKISAEPGRPPSDAIVLFDGLRRVHDSGLADRDVHHPR